MSGHELKHWLADRDAELAEARIRTVLGRGPTFGSQRGATWISFDAPNTLGRAILRPDGSCELSAVARSDGEVRLVDRREIESSGDLDDALAALVDQLT
jgi:hypothetical protein